MDENGSGVLVVQEHSNEARGQKYHWANNLTALSIGTSLNIDGEAEHIVQSNWAVVKSISGQIWPDDKIIP